MEGDITLFLAFGSYFVSSEEKIDYFDATLSYFVEGLDRISNWSGHNWAFFVCSPTVVFISFSRRKIWHLLPPEKRKRAGGWGLRIPPVQLHRLVTAPSAEKPLVPPTKLLYAILGWTRTSNLRLRRNL